TLACAIRFFPERWPAASSFPQPAISRSSLASRERSSCWLTSIFWRKVLWRGATAQEPTGRKGWGGASLPARNTRPGCAWRGLGGSAAATAARGSAPVPRTPALRYDFAYGRSDVEVFPFERWRRILLKRARKASVRDLDYGARAGSLALREAISAHLRRSRAVVCDASQVVVVNGSQQALDLVTRLLVERGDPVAGEDPQYLGAREVLRAAGSRLRPVPVDREGLNPARLPERARLVFVTPSHQFPTGGILSLPRRLALLEWAKRNNAVIVE